jgi:Zn-dependent peptidase ImmA (M78 family)
LSRLSADTFQTIRLAQAYQDSLYEILGEERVQRRIFRDISPFGLSIREVAAKVRQYLGLSTRQQFAFMTTENAFKGWRHALEEAGVFTFKDALRDKFISGFCLLDASFPVIMVNNSNSFARQVFTLAHELGHILFGVNGVSDVDESYLDRLAPPDRALEIECNRFASELLVPQADFERELSAIGQTGAEVVTPLAERFKVSREVVLRRLLDMSRISPATYQAKSREWNADYLRRRARGDGGNYCLTKLAYLGEGFTRAAFEQYRLGLLTKTELGTHLNLNSRHIDSLERRLGW